MKRIILVTLAFFLFTSITQSQWIQISTIGNNELKGVKFFNELTGVTVGQGGIWRSTNSGINWTQVLSGGNFNSLSFPDNNTGYCVGDSGKIYKTIDSGLNWIIQSSNVIDHLFSVSFFNISTGHAVGQNGKILRTQTGGSNWYQNSNQLSEDINCVYMVTNSSTAIAVGTIANVERFLSTANGGTNWIYSFSSGGASLKSVYPITQSIVISCGTNGRIRKSTNSGASWVLINSGVSVNLNNIYFIDNSTGYIFGNNGTLLKSTDAGNNWITQSSGTVNNLNGSSFINSNIGWAVGGNGAIIRIGIPVGINILNNNIPKNFTVSQNYPNPFNPATKFRIDINKAGLLSVIVFDYKGSLISILFDNYIVGGEYEFNINSEKYSSGIYIFKVQLDNNVISKKMVFIK